MAAIAGGRGCGIREPVVEEEEETEEDRVLPPLAVLGRPRGGWKEVAGLTSSEEETLALVDMAVWV